MPNSWITKSDGAEIRLAHPHNRVGMIAGAVERVYDLLTDGRFQNPDRAKVAAALKAIVQEDLTTRTRTRDLPDDEWTKTTDPVAVHGERMFWEGRGSKREVVVRSTIVESCVWLVDHYHFEMRRAR